VTEEMHGSDRESEPEKRLRASLWWYGHFNKSEMALFSECTDRYAQKLLDTADIVREAIYRHNHGDSTLRAIDHTLPGKSVTELDA
jgi:hypothetical protein